MAGLIALIIAAAAAIWLLVRVTAGNAVSVDARNITILKAVIWLGIVAALFAANLMPLALMILVAAGGVTAIEVWRNRTIEAQETRTDRSRLARSSAFMSVEQAACVLGISVESNEAEIRRAHKKLIAQLHPDKGGTDYLAGQINDARTVLLKGLST